MQSVTKTYDENFQGIHRVVDLKDSLIKTLNEEPEWLGATPRSTLSHIREIVKKLKLLEEGAGGFWEDIGGILIPTENQYVQAPSFFCYGDLTLTYTQINPAQIKLCGRHTTPYIHSTLMNPAGGATLANRTLLMIDAKGVNDLASEVTGASIIFKTGSQDFSDTNQGSTIDINSKGLNESTLYSRLHINDTGSILINKDQRETSFTVLGSTDENLFIVNSELNIIQVGLTATNAKVNLCVSTDEAKPTLLLNQPNAAHGFTTYLGVVSPDPNSGNITSYNGAGSVVGPKGQAGTEAHFSYAGMTKDVVTGVTVWRPYFNLIPAT